MQNFIKKYKVPLLILLAVVLIGATYLGRANYQSGSSNVIYFSDLDSAAEYTSNWFDATGWDGQTIMVNGYFKVGSTRTTADTITSITIEGRTAPGGNISTTVANYLVDTVDMVTKPWGSSAQSWTRVFDTGAGTLFHITLSPSYQYPQWRFKVKADANDCILVLNPYSKVEDYQPEHFDADGQ